MIFDRTLSIAGEHGLYLDHLAGQDSNRVFKRNIDVFLIAPLIGYLLGRSEDIKMSEEEKHPEKKIDLEQLNREATTIETIFQLVILLHYAKKEKTDIDTAVNRAFREPAKMQVIQRDDGEETHAKTEEHLEDVEIYLAYMRGGISYLYEHIIVGGNNFDDYIDNFVDYLENYSTYIEASLNCQEEFKEMPSTIH